MVQRALNKAPARTVITVTGRYDDATRRRMRAFRQARSLNPGDHFDQEALDALWPYFDAYGRYQYRLFKVPPAVPDLGPFVAGGRSVLDQDLTHATGGLSGFPAFDDGWGAGKPILAPEPLRVYRASSARRRDGRPNGMAFYARGVSGIRYWVGHTRDVPPISVRAKLTAGRFGPLVPKGAVLTVISGNHEEPHGHFGVNASELIGRELDHHTDYTHGAEKVGAQLRRALT